jgi:hypothetical protein
MRSLSPANPAESRRCSESGCRYHLQHRLRGVLQKRWRVRLRNASHFYGVGVGVGGQLAPSMPKQTLAVGVAVGAGVGFGDGVAVTIGVGNAVADGEAAGDADPLGVAGAVEGPFCGATVGRTETGLAPPLAPPPPPPHATEERATSANAASRTDLMGLQRSNSQGAPKTAEVGSCSQTNSPG